MMKIILLMHCTKVKGKMGKFIHAFKGSGHKLDCLETIFKLEATTNNVS